METFGGVFTLTVAELEATFKADTKNFEAGSRAVNTALLKNQNALLRMQKSLEGLNAPAATATRATQQLGNAAQRASHQKGLLSNALSNASSQLATYTKYALAAAAATGVALVVGSVKGAASFDALKRSFTNAVGGAQEAEQQLARLWKIAKLPGLGFREAIAGSRNLQAMGFSAEFAEKALVGFSKAIAASGGGREELAMVFTQLTQMASQDKIIMPDLRPILTQAPIVGKVLRDAFGTINPEELNKKFGSTKAFLEALVTELQNRIPDATNSAKNAMENFSDSLDQAFVKVGTPLLEPLTKALDALTPMMEQAAQSISTILPAIASEAKSIWADLPETTKAAFSGMLGAVEQLGGGIVSWFKENYPRIRETVITVLNSIAEFWRHHGEQIKAIVGGLLGSVGDVLKAGMQIINGHWAEGVQSLSDAFRKNEKALVGATQLTVSAAAEVVGDGESTLRHAGLQLGRALVDGVISGIESRTAALREKVSALADMTSTIFSSVLGIHSPSKVFIQYGYDIINGLVRGLKEGESRVENAMLSLTETIKRAFTGRERTVGTRPIEEAQRAIADALQHQADVLKELAGGESALDAINKLLANPNVAAMVDERTAALLRFNAALEDTLKLTRERVVGLGVLPPEMLADPNATRERTVGLPGEMRADPTATRQRRVLADTVAEARRAAGEIADDLTGIIGNAFDGLLEHRWRGFLQGMFDSAKSVFKQISDELINSLLRGLTGASPASGGGGLGGFFSGLLSSVIGSIAGGIGGGSFSTPGGGSFTPGSSTWHGWGLASGGPAYAGNPYLVGERGPEMFVPQASGTVVPNHQLAGNTYNIYMPPGAQNYTTPEARANTVRDLLTALRAEERRNQR